MADTQVIETKEVVKPASKKKATKTTKAKTTRAKTTKPQLTKEDVQAAVYEAMKAAMQEMKPAQEAQVQAVEPEMPKQEPKPVDAKRTFAEQIVSVFAYIYLAIGCLLSIGLIVVGAVSLIQQDSFLAQYDLNAHFKWIFIGVGVLLIFPTLVNFAVLKIYGDMSYRLGKIAKK